MVTTRHLIFRFSPLFAGAVVGWPQLIIGQVVQPPAAQNVEPPAAASNGDEYILRTYDVGDLLLDVPDYPYLDGGAPMSGRSRGTTGGAGTGFGGGGSGGGFFSVADEENRASDPTDITMDDLIDAIVSTVESESWSENGGGEADLRPVGSSLVILQSRRAHDQIAELLRQLENVLVERKTVTIDARWLLLNSEELDRLMLANPKGLPIVRRQSLAGFTRRPTTIRGLTSCFSGQLVYVVSGTRRNFVSGYIPVVGSLDDPRAGMRFAALRGGARFSFVSDETPADGGNEPRVGYQPIVERSSVGALLEIRPTITGGENTAIIDLRSTLTVPMGRSEGQSGQSEPVPAPPVVDRIAVDTQEFATTLRVPLGEPILVGGLTYMPPSIGSLGDAESQQPKEEALENRQFYLILELR